MASESDAYPLLRHSPESARLNSQHQYFLSIFGHHIHPTISRDLNLFSSLHPHAYRFRIADISCGTGIWLTDLCSQYPQITGFGFDVSDAQFPCTKNSFGDYEHKDSGASFEIQDAADPNGYDSQFTSAFDIVHIRLMHVNLTNVKRWEICVRNSISILRKGGWIQWQDWNCETAHIVSRVPNARKVAMEELLSGFKLFLKSLRL